MNGSDLRTWMTANGYTVRGLAAALQVAPSTVQNWVSGKYPMPNHIALALRALVRAESVA